jgi:hypothetical protein
MKTTKPIPVQKSRAHRVLFETGSPFRSRTVENKKQFKRQPKHKGEHYEK